MDMLRGMTKWRIITNRLRLNHSSMDIIETNNSNDVERCLELAITDWLKLNYDYETNGEPSWRKLAEAVCPLNRRISNDIVEKYPAGTYS